MPTRNGKKYCVNHPDKEMIPANEADEWRHVVALAVQREDKGYDVLQKASVMIIHACPICGYCESYLVQEEIDNLPGRDKI